MIPILFYYLFLPILGGWLVIKFIKRYGGQPLPADLQRMLLVDPIEKREYRALCRDGSGLTSLGDFEKHEEAVDAIYAAREAAQKAARKGSFLVVNAAGETLDLLDA